jgi:hypothetical protein
MLTEALSALAAAGGTAVVSAMATDAWRTAKVGFSRLLGRGDSGHTALVEQQLEATRAELQTAEGRGERALALQQAAWTARLEDLLVEQPHAADELRKLIQQISQTNVNTAGTVVQHVGGWDQSQQVVQGHGTQSNVFGSRSDGADGGR